MPKAPQAIQDEINSGRAEEGGATLLPGGFYLAQVWEVEEYEPTGDKEFGGVIVKYKILQPTSVEGSDGEPVDIEGTKQWDRLSHSPRSAFRWNMLFKATGYTPDSDLDELVEAEEQVILEISQAPITQGKKKGKMGNNIDMILPPTEDNLALLD